MVALTPGLPWLYTASSVEEPARLVRLAGVRFEIRRQDIGAVVRLPEDKSLASSALQPTLQSHRQAFAVEGLQA